MIIPYPKSLQDEEIIESMIRAYFMPICQGKLEIIVDGSHEIVTNSETISKICDKMTWAGKPAGAMATTNRKCMNGLIELANWWSVVMQMSFRFIRLQTKTLFGIGI